MNIKERLLEFLTVKNLKPSTFERNCGLSNGFVSKVNDNITDGSLALIQKGFPELNINWLKTGFGNMINEDVKSKSDIFSIPDMLNMMHEFILLGKKNSDANLLNAEANKINAKNLERLIDIIENKIID